MTMDRLIELASKFFNVKEDILRTNGRMNDSISMAKHCLRVLAYKEYRLAPVTISDALNDNRSNLYNSLKVITEYGQYEPEYKEFKSYVVLNGAMNTQIAIDPSGIERITNEAFDSRFYKHPTKLNKKTNNEFFPAFHHVIKLGAPEPVGLSKWRQTMGHFADHVMDRTAAIGSYVHDCIDRMIKSDSVIQHDDIHRAFEDPKEAQRVKECLLAFIYFIRDEEPVITASEQMMCGDDFGFTLDSKMKLKSDEYKSEFVVDWKTSKVASEDHKMQVEAMRRVSGADKAAVVVLGNSTKKKYTMTAVKPSEQDYLWTRFQAIKETAYVEMLKSGNIKPREDNMPTSFQIKDLKFKRKL